MNDEEIALLGMLLDARPSAAGTALDESGVGAAGSSGAAGEILEHDQAESPLTDVYGFREQDIGVSLPRKNEAKG